MVTGFFGKGDAVTAVVRIGRFAYVTSAVTILVAWYTSWRNQRVAPNEKTKWPIPGVSKDAEHFPASREDPDISTYASGSDLVGASISGGSIASPIGGLPGPGATGPITIPGGIGNQRISLVQLGHIAQNRFHLRVSEHPAFGGVTPGVHARNSWHYKGRAFDASGSIDNMRNFAAFVRAHYGAHVLELIHNSPKGGISMANGKDISSSYWGAATWANHRNHVHLAM